MTEEESVKYNKDAERKSRVFLRASFVCMDEYGKYYTGTFLYKGKFIIITMDGGKWHLSASTNHPLGYNEMKELRYKFLPDNIQVAQIFPPRKEFVNIHENCYHLWQI